MLAAAGLAGLILVAWHNSFGVPFLFDDEKAILANPTLDSLGRALVPPTDSGSTVSGRPLLNLSFAVNRALHGTDVTGYHVGNLLIHVTAALTLLGLLRRTLRLPPLAASFGENAGWIAWFGAALWAVHPLQTESVTYIVQRAESLVGLLYLFTLYAFVRGVTAPSRPWLALAVLACWAGMAAKEVMATAPILLFFYDRTFLAGTFREAWTRRRAVYLALAASWALLAGSLLVSGGRGDTVGFGVVNWLDYALTQGPGICGYLRKAVLPAGLVFDYGALVENRTMPVVLGVSAVVLLLAATGVLLRRRPALGFLGAWFFVILAPSSSVIPVASQTLAEHRMYLPLAAVVLGALLVIHRLPARRARAVLALLLAAATGGTIARNRDYATAVGLWEDTVAKAPNNVRALNNLGVLQWRAARLDAAAGSLGRAVDLAPGYADACSNLGAVLVEQQAALPAGRRDAAAVDRGLALLRRAIALEPRRPLFHAALGVALFRMERFDEAAAAVAEAHRLEPAEPVHLFNLANALALSSTPAAAEATYRQHLAREPADAESHREFGILLRRLRRLPESVDELATAVRLAPDSALARTQLGISLQAAGDRAGAMREFEAALRLSPDLPLALKEKGYALAESGRADEAIAILERLAAGPNATAEIASNLAVLYSRAGRQDLAEASLRRALELDPANAVARQNLQRLEQARAQNEAKRH